jgi:LysM repeat protein
MDPLRSAPSRGVFRVALFGLFGGAVLALWLLVRPPSVPGQENVTRNDSTATPALTPAGAGGGVTSTPEPTAAAASSTPEPTATPMPTATPVPTPVPTPAPVYYTVQDGDTWYGIAGAYGVNAQTLASINGHTLDDLLHPGQTLQIPQ